MQFTNDQLVEIAAGLRAVADKEFPAAVRFRLARWTQKINKEIKLYDEHRMALIKKYNGVLEGDRFKFAEGDELKFNDEFLPLRNETVDITYKLIDEKELEGFPIPQGALTAISPLITEPE